MPRRWAGGAWLSGRWRSRRSMTGSCRPRAPNKWCRGGGRSRRRPQHSHCLAQERQPARRRRVERHKPSFIPADDRRGQPETPLGVPHHRSRRPKDQRQPGHNRDAVAPRAGIERRQFRLPPRRLRLGDAQLPELGPRQPSEPGEKIGHRLCRRRRLGNRQIEGAL